MSADAVGSNVPGGAATPAAAGRIPNVQGGRGGRGRGYQGRNPRNTNANRTPPGPTFKGDTPDMNGHVYQTFNENDDKRQFGKTTEALGRWINMNTKNLGDLMTLYTDLSDPTAAITRPENLDATDAAVPIEQLLWKETVKDYITRRQSLVDNLRAVYSVIWGQCSPTMKAKLMSLTNYETES